VFSYEACYGEGGCGGLEAEGYGCEAYAPGCVVEEESYEGDEGEAHSYAEGCSLDVVYFSGGEEDLDAR
jgi:hypothetical protein